MRATNTIILALAVVLAASHSLSAQHMKGDVAEGRHFAQIWCSGCHAVTPEAVGSAGTAPDFPSIANRRSTTARRLIRFLYTQHKVMPNFEIELDDATNVAAYIVSLKRR